MPVSRQAGGELCGELLPEKVGIQASGDVEPDWEGQRSSQRAGCGLEESKLLEPTGTAMYAHCCI